MLPGGTDEGRDQAGRLGRLGVSESDRLDVAPERAVSLGLVEFPGGELSLGAGEPSGDAVVDGGRWDGGEGFAVERVAGPGE